MSAKLGVLIVHGMGSQRRDFADDFIESLARRIDGSGAVSGEVAFKPAYWADVLDSGETELWDAMRDTKLRYRDIRQFVVSALGDAVAYQRVSRKTGLDAYAAIHDRIHNTLAALRGELGGDKPLIVVAHSLGAVVMSNYIWDRQAAAAMGAPAIPSSAGPAAPAVGGAQTDPLASNAFESMKTLSGFITYGTTLPLFTLAYPRDEIKSIALPPPGLAAYFPGVAAEKVREAARWTNFYDADDILGYPLKPISASYEQGVSEDVQIDVGMWPLSMTPASHTAYDGDSDFINPVAAAIGRVWALCA